MGRLGDLGPAPLPAPGATRLVIDLRPLQEPERSPVTAAYLGHLLEAFAADALPGAASRWQTERTTRSLSRSSTPRGCMVHASFTNKSDIRHPASPGKRRSLYMTNTMTAAEEKTIVGVAVDAGQFKTLVAAVQAAGLVETLNGSGPFTVFAPTDAAFAELPAGTVENLIKPENKEKLIAILTYHVLAGKVMAADVKTSSVKTVNGKDLSIVVNDGEVTINGATVVATDVAAKNGVIHVIDSVLLP